MDCPVCPHRGIQEGQLVCPNCRTDLTLLLRARELPVLAFNRALGGVQSHRANTEQTVSELLFSIQLSPRLVEPRVVLGKLYAQRGDYSMALGQLWQAQKLDAQNEEVRHCIAAIFAAQGRSVSGDDCLEARRGGKPVYLWSTVQFLDDGKVPIQRLVPKKGTGELSFIVVRSGGVLPRQVILRGEQIREIDGETVLLNVRTNDVGLLPRWLSDGSLARSVEEALSAYGPIGSLEHPGIRVEASDAAVLLSGNVHSDITREMAGRIARSVPGVLELKNALHSDSRLESILARAVAGLGDGGRIRVSSRLGEVVLEGEVPSTDARDATGDVARATEGVRTVVNRLAVVSPDRDRDGGGGVE